MPAIGVVAVSVLISAWGTLIAACFCPQSRTHMTMLTQVAEIRHESSCDHEMSDLKKDDAERRDMEATSPDSSDHPVIGSPAEPCTHCITYSQRQSIAALPFAVDPARRLMETGVAAVNVELPLPSGFLHTIIPSEHGPPGTLLPRHVLISVFRI